MLYTWKLDLVYCTVYSYLKRITVRVNTCCNFSQHQEIKFRRRVHITVKITAILSNSDMDIVFSSLKAYITMV